MQHVARTMGREANITKKRSSSIQERRCNSAERKAPKKQGSKHNKNGKGSPIQPRKEAQQSKKGSVTM